MDDDAQSMHSEFILDEDDLEDISSDVERMVHEEIDARASVPRFKISDSMEGRPCCDDSGPYVLTHHQRESVGEEFVHGAVECTSCRSVFYYPVGTPMSDTILSVLAQSVNAHQRLSGLHDKLEVTPLEGLRSWVSDTMSRLSDFISSGDLHV